MGYTLRYGRTYLEWAGEKARRILKVLRLFYLRGLPLDFQLLASATYMERLLGVGKLKWKPLENRFLDKKPSAFMKNFLAYLVERLKEDGYLRTAYTVEVSDLARTRDTPTPDEKRAETTPIRMYVAHWVVRVPTLDYLTDLCTWRDPDLEELYLKAIKEGVA